MCNIGYGWQMAIAGVVFLLSWLESISAAPLYPVKVGPSGRYLVDQNNVPFLIVGDSPQAMIGKLTPLDAELFFQTRQSQGFNAVLIDVLCASYTGCYADGRTFDGVAPFTALLKGYNEPNYDLRTPNEEYFARVDTIIQLAAKYGLLVILDPAETGSWLIVMQSNGVDNCRTYGQFLGQRYGHFDNILWMHGNDYGPPHADLNDTNDALVTAVALGIKDFDSRHLHTVLFNTNTNLPPVLSTDNPRWLSIIDLNAAYTYQATHVEVLAGYNYSPPVPVFMAESGYEFESIAALGSAPRNLRAQEYWSLLSGATGQLYGNGVIWPFIAGWQNRLDSPGAVQIAHVKTLFEPRRWYNLVPDQAHAIVTFGYGAFGHADYVTAARTTDGTLVMAYVPTARTVTVDMGQLSGAMTARWYDPANGAFSSIPGSPFANVGLLSFTTPGKNSDGDEDWVLVLESGAEITSVDTVITSSPAAVSNNTSASFSFASTAPSATFACSLDGGAFAACTSPKTYTKLKAGTHNFRVQAIAGGLADSIPASLDWTIDTTVPNTTIISGPPALTNDPVATFTFASTEASSSFQCSLDRSAFAPCSSPFVSNPLSDGRHAFQVKAVDAAGNVDKTAAKAKVWTVDATPPITTIISKPTNPTTSATVAFKFTSEKKSTFQCRLDGGAFTPCRSGQNYSGLAKGSHNFQVLATDAAGNVELTPASFTWDIN